MAIAACSVMASVSSAEAEPQGSQAESGAFVFGTNMSVVPVDDDILREEPLLGYKLGRLLLSASAYYANHDIEIVPEFGRSHRTEETFLVSPEAQFSFLRSANARVEMIGILGGGVGTWHRWSTVTEFVGTGGGPLMGNGTFVTTETSGRGARVQWHLGTGVRFWPHPGFALHLAAGILGDYRLTSSGSFSDPPVQPFVQVGLLVAPALDVNPKQEKPRQRSQEIGFAFQSGVSSSPRDAFDGSLGLGLSLYRFVFTFGADVPRLIKFREAIPNAEIQGTVMRSADRRLELFLSGSAGFSIHPTRHAFRWRAAPGIRFWPTPGLAITGAVGVLGEDDDKPYDGGDPFEDHHYITMFGRVGILSVIK